MHFINYEYSMDEIKKIFPLYNNKCVWFSQIKCSENHRKRKIELNTVSDLALKLRMSIVLDS